MWSLFALSRCFRSLPPADPLHHHHHHHHDSISLFIYLYLPTYLPYLPLFAVAERMAARILKYAVAEALVLALVSGGLIFLLRRWFSQKAERRA